MKTKKLWALLVAAVMVIGLLPVSAFAALGTVNGTPDSTLNFSLGTKSWSFSNSDFKTYGSGTTTVTVTKTIDISYDEISTGALLLNITNPKNQQLVVTKPNNWAAASLAGTYYGPVSYNVTFTSKALGTTDNSFQVTQNGLNWDIDGDQSDLNNVTSVIYQITFNVTAPTLYTVSIAPSSRVSGVTVVGTNTSLTQYNATSNVSVSVPKETLVGFTKPSGKNPGNNTYEFSYWQFDKSVTIGVHDGAFNKDKTALSTLITTNTSTGVDADTTFRVPVNGFTATAIDTSGAAWGTAGTGGSGNASGTYSLSVSNGVIYYVGGVYKNTTTVTSIAPNTVIRLLGTYTNGNDYWTVDGVRYSGSDITFNMPSKNITAYYSNYDDGIYTVSAGSATGGYASVDDSSAYNGQSVKISATPYSGYYFAGWSIGSNATYSSGYNSTSNPTYITVTGNTTITPSFSYGYDYGYGYYPGTGGMPGGYYPGGTYYPGASTLPGTVNTGNTFGTGTAQASVTSSGVTAGYNASGSINSTNTVNAVTRYFANNRTATALNITIPSTATAMSASTARKIITAAGTKTVTLVNSTSFGSLSYDLSSARNYYFAMSTTGSRYTSARNTIVRAYGNSDTRGFSMSVNNLGSSGTFRIKVASLGLSASAGDTVYALFYNPSTNGFTRKTLVVNSAGEVAYATTRGGVHLFSETPFAK